MIVHNNTVILYYYTDQTQKKHLTDFRLLNSCVYYTGVISISQFDYLVGVRTVIRNNESC